MPEQFWTDIKEVEKATEGGLFLVLTDNIKGLFSLGVKIRTKGSYGHMMWRVPGGFASQWFYFRMFLFDHFAGCTMKFIYNPDWTARQREILLNKIKEDLAKPWYKSLYDVPAIIGQLIGWDWLQFGKAMICSERITYLRLIDPEADEWLKVDHTPTPTDVNAWTKARGDRYKVFGRYSPD
jgi:hypothetical protein